MRAFGVHRADDYAYIYTKGPPVGGSRAREYIGREGLTRSRSVYPDARIRLRTLRLGFVAAHADSMCIPM